MDHNERADELEKEAERLEHESEKLGESTDQARSDWEARKADPSSAPGAAGPEGSGPHNIDAEDPATGRKYGERRQDEIDDVRAADSDGEDDDSEDANQGDSGEDADNDST
jgi:hypothetical protein